MSMHTCPLCHGEINRHDFIYGFVCERNVGGKMCGYTSNQIIFSQPLPPGTFGLRFLRTLIELSSDKSPSIPETTS
jgi:hypothetical protein